MRAFGDFLKCQPRTALTGGGQFADILEFKRLLLAYEPQVAINCAGMLIVCAAGTPVSFADRDTIDRLLNGKTLNRHGVRSIPLVVTQSAVLAFR